jgi:hypothetical protein
LQPFDSWQYFEEEFPVQPGEVVDFLGTRCNSAWKKGERWLTTFARDAAGNFQEVDITRYNPAFPAAPFGRPVKMAGRDGAVGLQPVAVKGTMGSLDWTGPITCIVVGAQGDLQKENFAVDSGNTLEVEASFVIDAIMSQDEEAFEDLIQRGFTLNQRVMDRGGSTPLLEAIRWRNLKVVNTLINAGADPLFTDCHGRTALDVAVEAGSLQVLRFILDLGIHVDTQDSWGSTAMHWAAARMDGTRETLDCMLALFEREPDCYKLNWGNLTATSIAERFNNIM